MERLLELGKRVRPELEQATTKWGKPRHSEIGMEFVLAGQLQIPIGCGFNGSAKLHKPLLPNECTFACIRRLDDHGCTDYALKAKISFSTYESWYLFRQQFMDSIELPVCTMYELEKGFHLPVPKEYQDRAKVVGECLFWSLTSPDGIAACRGTAHSPIQLFEIWREMVMKPFFEEAES